MSLRAFERRLTTLLEAVLAAGLLGMFLVVVLLVVLRYAFQSGLVGANETATVVFVYLSSLGAAVAVGRQEHIRVDLLSARLGRRGRLVLEACNLGMVAILNAVLAASSVAWIDATGQTLMPVTQMPRYLLQASVPLGCGLATLYCAIKLVTLFRKELAR
ncbi:MAG: TRAP transporter small permease [Bryobacterales bacterium]|nr:TRAP transporter small permease [Bryobacterales bacterium]